MAQLPDWAVQSSAGRYERNPHGEVSRLLDELERQRQGLGQISFDPTQQDIELQQRLQAALLQPALAQASGQFGARGLSGSSMEAMRRTLTAGQIGLQGEQQLYQRGMERGQAELGRNRQLYESLISSITPTAENKMPEKKKGGGWGGIIGGALGAIGGSFLGNPMLGAQIGSSLGSSIGGGGGGGGGDGKVFGQIRQLIGQRPPHVQPMTPGPPRPPSPGYYEDQ